MKRTPSEVNALYTNHISLSVNNLGVRITFGESISGAEADAMFHTAIQVPHQVATAIAELIVKATNDFTAKMKASAAGNA